MSKYLEQFAKLRCRDDIIEALGEKFVNRKHFRRDLVQAMAMIRFIRKHIPQERQHEYNLFDLHSTNQVFPVLAAFMTKFDSIHVYNENIHMKNCNPACRDVCMTKDAEPGKNVDRLFYYLYDSDNLQECSKNKRNVAVSILPEDPSDIMVPEFPIMKIEVFFLNPRCGELPKRFNLGRFFCERVRVDPIDIAAPSKFIVGDEILVVNQDWNILSEHDVMIYSGWLTK